MRHVDEGCTPIECTSPHGVSSVRNAVETTRRCTSTYQPMTHLQPVASTPCPLGRPISFSANELANTLPKRLVVSTLFSGRAYCGIGGSSARAWFLRQRRSTTRELASTNIQLTRAHRQRS